MSTRQLDTYRIPLGFVFALAIVSLAFLNPSPGVAQQGQQSRVVPRDEYFNVLRGYRTGEYRQAARAFKRVANGGVRSTEGRWVDSICYHTMLGECYYQMGELGLALDQYDAALALVVKHSDWMLRVQFPQTITPSGSTVRSRITWGGTARGTRLGNFPETMSSFQGRLNNENAFRQGGVVTPPSFYPLRVNEIVRCSGLALYRRWELMGPVGKHVPATRTIVDALAKRSAPANHWSQAWIDAQLGLARAAAGDRAEAVTHLRKAAAAGGDFDHVLTPVVLLALGQLFLADGNLEQAGNHFLEASFAGATFGQPDVVQEAFRHGLTVHLASGKQGAYPPLVRAQPWARREGFDALESWLYVTAAESYSAAGDAARAKKLLDEARRTLLRSEARAGELGARFEYQNAVWNFQQGDAANGVKSLNLALGYQKTSSPRLLHIALADKAFTSGTISPRVAKDLYAGVLRDPGSADWALDPLDSLAVLTTPLAGPMENWFAVAVQRKESDLALQISERIRRRRFFAAMPLGGRLLALRRIMEAPKESLPDHAVVRRQDLLGLYPGYAELQRKSEAIRAELAEQPLAPSDAQAVQAQKKLYAEWTKIAAAQEAILSEIALRRERADLLFPPIRKVEELQNRMSERQLVLSFFNTSRGMAVFLFNNSKFTAWQIDEPAKVVTALKSLLKEMGHFEANQPLAADELNSKAWRKPATELLNLVMRNPKPDFWDDYDELVIVPDGIMWYVPFEALPASADEESDLLLAKVRIRYAPTIGLALPDDRGRKPAAKTAVVAGRLFPRDDDDMAAQAAEDIQAVLPETSTITDVLPAHSSILKTQWDRLIVLDDVDDRSLTGFDWSPAQIDRGKFGSKLADWFSLPWGSPQVVMLPGFHTAAENSLKRAAGGDEVFLSLCALMSTGTRTILLSRWRTGGQNSFDLVREFAQELPRTSAAKAWQRSVILARGTRLDIAREPRVKLSPSDEPPLAEHPFFWSGYMLVDTGSRPPKDGARKKILEIK